MTRSQLLEFTGKKPEEVKGLAKKKGEYDAPELPKSLNPADVHNYYMNMASWHDKNSWKNQRLSGIKPLWSDSRNMHSDKALFHKAMRDGFAQKALGVDLAAQHEERGSAGAGKRGFGESIETPGYVVDHSIHTLEQLIEKYGDYPLEGLRSGRIESFVIKEGGAAGPSQKCSNCGAYNPVGLSGAQRPTLKSQEEQYGTFSCGNCHYDNKIDPKKYVEAFSGIDPTRALPDINQNKPPNNPVLDPKSTTNIKHTSLKMPASPSAPKTLNVSSALKPMEATQMIADGKSIDEALRILLK